MSEQILQRGNAVERSRTRTIAQVAMLGAVAGVLMNLEFPIPFLAPSFYQLDFSEVPAVSYTHLDLQCMAQYCGFHFCGDPPCRCRKPCRD